MCVRLDEWFDEYIACVCVLRSAELSEEEEISSCVSPKVIDCIPLSHVQLLEGQVTLVQNGLDRADHHGGARPEGFQQLLVCVCVCTCVLVGGRRKEDVGSDVMYPA